MARMFAYLVAIALIGHLCLAHSPSPSPSQSPSSHKSPSLHVPSPDSTPSPSSHESPSPSPSPIVHGSANPSPSPSPYPNSLSLGPPSPSSFPAPGESPDTGNSADEEKIEDPKSSSGMSTGRKAGVAVAVVFGVAFAAGGFAIYKKRQENIRRSQYGYAARRELLWRVLLSNYSVFVELIQFLSWVLGIRNVGC